MSRPTPNYSDVFRTAWEAYPRKHGHSKSLAWKRWLSLLTKGWGEEDLLDLVYRYAAQERSTGTEDKYIKHMSTFLNHDLLMDMDFHIERPDDGSLSLEDMQRSLGL